MSEGGNLVEPRTYMPEGGHLVEIGKHGIEHSTG